MGLRSGVTDRSSVGVELILPSLDCDKAKQMLVAGAKGEVLPKLLQVLVEAGAGVTLASN